MSQVTVISGVERRRIRTDEQKRALVAEIARRRICGPASYIVGGAIRPSRQLAGSRR